MTSNRFAWVTLTTNDSYAMGALVLASSLKQVSTTAELVCLTTGNLSQSVSVALRSAFNRVHGVTLIDSNDSTILNLMRRPELGVTLTKLHCWRLLEYEKCVFLDADTMVLQNCDELFECPELSAAPDVGWPDCFNSGMFVFRPNEERFQQMLQFMADNGSFDGGDQGLLNEFFKNWNRLSFTYNTSSSTVYSYLPAFKQFEKDVRVLHFLGPEKPWNMNFNEQTQILSSVPFQYKHSTKYLEKWWELFTRETLPLLRAEGSLTTPAVEEIRASVAAMTIQRPRRTEPSLEAWEQNDIDYKGIDSFNNILSHIETTIKQGETSADATTTSHSHGDDLILIMTPPRSSTNSTFDVEPVKIPNTELQHAENIESKEPKAGTFEAWLMGEIDYMGIDAFDNILVHLWKTIVSHRSFRKQHSFEQVPAQT